MARYTIQLRNVISLFGENTVKSWFTDYDLSDFLTSEQIAVITEAGIFDKDKLATRIINHYYMDEIGLETPALFRHFAKIKMEEIMEEKAPVIYSAAIEYNPLHSVDYYETMDRDTTSGGTSSSSSTSNGSGLNVHSDTPQGQISKETILGGSYASDTNANEATESVSDSSTTSGTGTEDYTKHIYGTRGVADNPQKLIELYRKNIKAISRDIIKELSTLFMGIY